MRIKNPIVSDVSDGFFRVDFLHDGHAVTSGDLSKKIGVDQVKEAMTMAVQSYVDKRSDVNFEAIKKEIAGEVDIPDITTAAAIGK